MTLADPEFTLVAAGDDRARRRKHALGLVGVLVCGTILSMVAGSPGYVLSALVVAGGLVGAARGGALARARALLQLGAIRREGLVATRKLKSGDVAGARDMLRRLLVVARPLGAFHAVHLLNYGIARFLDGETDEGIVLARRVIGSGWLQRRPTPVLLDSAESWLTLMLLEAGELTEASRLLRGATPVAAAIVAGASQGQWEAMLEQAQQALADPECPMVERAALAALALCAARRLRRDLAPYRVALDAELRTLLALDAEPLRL